MKYKPPQIHHLKKNKKTDAVESPRLKHQQNNSQKLLTIIINQRKSHFHLPSRNFEHPPMCLQ